MVADDASINKAKGGYARAEALTPEQRKAIARKAAQSRWLGSAHVATHEGDFDIGGASISAAVLEDGRRLITQAAFLRALGRARSPKAGTGVLTTVDELPFFLQADALKPFITEELVSSTKPIFYQTKDGGKGVGYDAELLPRVCEVYLRFRDDSLAKFGKVPGRYAHIIRACDLLMRGLATVGIVALVDEATGYQEVRDRRALEAILDRFLRKELAAWAKRFPDEFYQEVFRLKGWQWKGMSINRPSVVGKYTNDLVYQRLAPGILEELQVRNPKDQRGKRKNRHHQWLTEDVGHPALAQHLYALTGFMRVSTDWEQFYRMVSRAFPKKNETMLLGFSDL
jgi:hypothetical protein